MPIDYVCKELHIDMETGAVTEDYLGTVSELEFVIFATTEKYSYENYTEYINIIQKYGNEYIGKLMTETEIMFFIED